MRPEYYEGILQLRHPSEDLLDFVDRAIERDGKVKVAKVQKVRNGVDLYLSSLAFLRQIGKRLREVFGGELIFSTTATGTNKSGKFQVRMNVLFRLFPFKKGSKIIYRGEEYEVVETAHKVRIRNLETKKSITVGYDEVQAITE